MNIARDQIQTVAARLQIIYAGLAMGVFGFSAVAYFVNVSTADATLGETLMIGLLGALAVGQVMAWTVLRQLLQKQYLEQRRTAAESELETLRAGHLTVSHIIPGAMIEGFGLLGAVLFMITRVPWLLVAPAVAVAGLLAMFPTADRMTQYLERLERRL